MSQGRATTTTMNAKGENWVRTKRGHCVLTKRNLIRSRLAHFRTEGQMNINEHKALFHLFQFGYSEGYCSTFLTCEWLGGWTNIQTARSLHPWVMGNLWPSQGTNAWLRDPRTLPWVAHSIKTLTPVLRDGEFIEKKYSLAPSSLLFLWMKCLFYYLIP